MTHESLFELAREQRDLSSRIYSSYAHEARRFPSNQDPIRGEMARLTANFYGRVGAGEDIEIVFVEILEQAKAAARRYNAQQEAVWGTHDARSWTGGVAGYYGEDEAETKLRHARTVALALLETAKPKVEPLSPAEIRVLRLIAHGMCRMEIARSLGISKRTVNHHEHNIYPKLGVNNRTQAALYAWRTGLVDINDAWATVQAQREAVKL